MFEIKQLDKKVFNERYYQKEAIEKAIEDLENTNRSLVVMATGTGKNFVLNMVAKHFIDKNEKVLIICDRDELIDQLLETSKNILGESKVTLEKSKSYANRNISCTVASIQSISIDSRLHTFDKKQFDLIIIDECHKMMTKSYFKVIEYFNPKVLGLTATPERSDDNQLGDFFENISYQYNLINGIKDGYLANIKGKRITDIANIDISDLKFKTDGEFNRESEKKIERRILTNIDAIIDSIYNETKDKKTLVFCVSVNVAELISDKLKQRGLKSECVSYKTKSNERKRIISDYKTNKISHLINCTLLTVGFDCVDIEAIYMAKPINSKVMYSQSIGRGTRPYTYPNGNKKILIVYELTFNSTKHNLATTWQLFQNGNIKFSDKVVNKLNNKDNQEIGLFEVEQEIINEQKEILDELDKYRNKVKSKNNNFEFTEYDPLSIGEMLEIDFDAIRYNNSKLRGFTTSKQCDFLRKFNISEPNKLSKSQAGAIIDFIIKNKFNRKKLDEIVVNKYNETKEKFDTLRNSMERNED